MALSKQQWFDKIKQWVPQWFFEESDANVAHFQALAKVLETIDQDSKDYFNETFILKSSTRFLTEHGRERLKTQRIDEVDSDFARRVQNIFNQSNKVAIKALVDSLIGSTNSLVLEKIEDSPYFSRQAFFSRQELFMENGYNHFYVIMPRQEPLFDVFFSREVFYSRQAFLSPGGSISDPVVFELVFQAIQDVRAAGVSFILIERVITAGDTEELSGDGGFSGVGPGAKMGPGRRLGPN